MQQKYINYLNKVDNNTESLLKRYKSLIEISSLSNTRKYGNEGNEDEDVDMDSHSSIYGSHSKKAFSRNQNGELNMIATSTLTIESNATNIVRLLEELLLITRQLKEIWLLNRLPNSLHDLNEHYNPETIKQYEKQNEFLESMIDGLLDKIACEDVSL